MRIFIAEYVTGGGLAGLPLPPTLAAEGAAMLQAVVSDFVALGSHEVITLRDPRLETRLPAAVTQVVATGSFGELVDTYLAMSDVALVIAPETGGVLAELTERIEAAGVINLGCSSDAVRLCGDKLVTIQRVAATGVAVPPTWSVATPAQALARGLPVVVKPRDGAGALGVRLVRDAARVNVCWAEASAASGSGVVAQRYVGGQHASASLLCAASGAFALSLNGQTIVEGERFEYRGGVVPLAHPSAAQALDVATTAVRAIRGLRGWVGVDLVLGNEPTVIEINPRLTTSYAGLRKAVDLNLAGLLIDAARGALPETLDVTRRARFTAAGEVSAVPLAEAS